MADLITVQYARKDGRVALWERHPEHPAGEIYLASAEVGPVQVAPTVGVLAALRDGSLIEVRPPAPAPAKAAK